MQRHRARRGVQTCRAMTLVAGVLLALAGAPAQVCAQAEPASGAEADAAGDAMSTPPVAWLTLREGKIEARHQDRPLLVFFTATWSTSGVRIDREVWTDLELRRYVADHLVAARVEFQEAEAVARHYGVAEPPALMVLSPQGEPLVVLRGSQGTDSYLRVATYAGSRAWEHTDYATWLSRRGVR